MIINSNSNELDDRCSPLGGQAVIEGVMMRSKKKISVAVRNPEGEIIVKSDPFQSWTEKYKILGLPFIRGIVSLIETLVIGIRTLNYSAEISIEEVKEENKFMTTISLIIGILLAILLFLGLPAFVFTVLKKYIQNIVLLNLIEGGFRVTLFLIYLWAISFSNDIKRVFQYHGAEHKTIFTYESGEELTVENARKYSPLHPRCGTSFILLTLVISIVLFSFLGRSPTWLIRIISKISLLPVVAGISYELIKQAGKIKKHSKNILVLLSYFLTLPGIWLQKLTTREPDDKQLEVAIVSLKNVLER